MKSFKSYLKEYGALDPFQPMGGSSSGPGMGQYDPISDLNAQKQLIGPSVPQGKFKKRDIAAQESCSMTSYDKSEASLS